jgi:zinc protease
LRAEFLPRDLDQGLSIVADCLLHPSFPEQDLDVEKRALMGRSSGGGGSDAEPRQAWRLFRQAITGERARASDVDPLPALSRVRLLEHYRRHYPVSRLAIAIVGDVDPARAIAVLAPDFAVGQETQAPAVTAPASPSGPAEPTVVSRTTTTGGGEAVVSYPTFAPGDPDRVVMEVVAEMLAGDGGRVHVALRQESARTLGCRAGGRAAAGVEPGFVAVTLSCPPQHLEFAVAIARAELGRLATAGAAGEELGTRAAVADALALDEVRGLPPLAHRRQTSALLRVGAADVTRAVRRALDPKREVVSVVSGAGS